MDLPMPTPLSPTPEPLPTPLSPTPEPPLPDAEAPSLAIGNGLPSALPHSPHITPLQMQEAHVQTVLQAQHEIRESFHWLAEMLHQNKKRGWGTGYRDFVDISLVLRAVAPLGMAEHQGNRISGGVFSASTGVFSLSFITFIDVMHLGYTSSTWRNKLTTYFRMKALYQYSQHTGGITFQNPSHDSIWKIIKCWMENQDTVLEESWVTTRLGNTELRELTRDMLQEVYGGEQFTLSISFVPWCSNMILTLIIF